LTEDGLIVRLTVLKSFSFSTKSIENAVRSWVFEWTVTSHLYIYF